MTPPSKPQRADADVIARVRVTFDRPAALDEARVLLASRFLTERGLDSSAYKRAAAGTASVGLSLAGIVLPLGESAATASGYRSVVAPHGNPPDGMNGDPIPPEVQAALVPEHATETSLAIPGVLTVAAPTEGCIAEAIATIYGSVKDWLVADHFVVAGVRQFSSEALRHPDVVAAAADYASCMAAAGYDFANPAEAAQFGRKRWIEDDPDGVPSAEEIAMAQADARCQSQTRIYEVIDTVLLALAHDWLVTNGPTVLRAAEIHERAVTLATRLVEENGEEST